MLALVPILARFGVPERLQKALSALLIVAVVVASLVLLIQWNRHDAVNEERQRQAVNRALEKAAAERLQRAADQLAAATIARREAQIAADRKELDDALARLPDAPTTAIQRAAACTELRRLGRTHPAC